MARLLHVTIQYRDFQTRARIFVAALVILGIRVSVDAAAADGKHHVAYHGSEARVAQAQMLTQGAAAELGPSESTDASMEDGADAFTGRLKSLYPWYHTSTELRAEAERLAGSCGGALSIHTVEDSGVAIDVVDVRAPGSQPTNRGFFLFGEHSRELISPETGLHFLKTLCGSASGEAGTLHPDLQESEFRVVLNGNPRSRLRVELGEFCLRTNPDDVDLNRNWDEKWQNQSAMFGDTTNPGPRPFSEPETRIFKNLVTEFKPTCFLTVHSGTRGMYMPWAYDTSHLARRLRAPTLNILKDLDAKHCQCPYGAAGAEVGYACPGTSLDWVYEHETPYSFAFEIFGNPHNDAELKARWDKKLQTGGSSLLEDGAHLAHKHFANVFRAHASDFVHVRRRHTLAIDTHSSSSASVALLAEHTGSNRRSLRGAARRATAREQACFDNFNPATQEHYTETLSNWADTYLELARRVAGELRQTNVSSLVDLRTPTA